MTHSDYITRRIDAHLNRGERIPIDLFYEALGAGLDVDAIERRHNAQQKDD